MCKNKILNNFWLNFNHNYFIKFIKNDLTDTFCEIIIGEKLIFNKKIIVQVLFLNIKKCILV